MILASFPINLGSKNEPQGELCCLKVYKSTGVEVHLVIVRGCVKPNLLFPSFLTVRVPTSAQIMT